MRLFRRKIPHLDPLSFSSDKQRDFFAYWQKIKGDLFLPRRKDLDPRDIPHLLPAIWMADVINGEELYFRVRLIGTDLARAFKVENTNQRLDDIALTEEVIKRFHKLVKTKKPNYHVRKFPLEVEEHKYYSTLTLPLSNDEEKVDIIISVIDFFD